MASITASLPSFLQSCLGVRAPGDSADAAEPRRPNAPVAMAQGPLSDLYKGAADSRKEILGSSQLKERYDSLAKGQRPKYYIITCSDSRVNPPAIFSMGPGDIFEMQQLGALMPETPKLPLADGRTIDSEWANVSFAVRELKVEHLIVLGHTGCGAVGGIMSPDAIAHNHEVAAHLAKHMALKELVEARFKGLTPAEMALAAVGESVLQTMEKVRQFAPVQEAMAAGRLTVAGMVYEIANHGVVSEWDADKKEFVVKNKNPKLKEEVSMLPRRHRPAQA